MNDRSAITTVDAAKIPDTRLRFGLTRNVLLLSVASFLTDVSSEMSITFLPFFLANVLGLKTGVIGLIEGVAESTASLTKFFSGWLSDRWRSRKWIMVVGYAVSAVSKPFLYVAGSWEAVLGVRFADRVGKGIRSSPRDALLAASTPKESRGFAFGFHRGADTAGACLGLLAVALIIYLVQGAVPSLHLAAFRRIVLVAMLPALLAVAVLLAIRETALPVAEARTAVPPSPLGRRFRWFVVAAGLFALANSSDAFLLLRAQQLGLSVFAVALTLAGFNLLYSIISPLAGHWSDRWSRHAVVTVGWAIYALAYLGFGLARAPWQVWSLFGFYALYYGVSEGTARALVADMIPDAQRGTAYGIYSATIGLMALPASLLAGVVWQGIGSWSGFGPSAPFLVGAGLACCALMTLQLAHRAPMR